jgi:L-ascorbate metabolism protein UlaG (beta-lactamase superfamily)
MLEHDNSRLIVDPVNKQSGDFDGDIMFCTHNHFDHVGGVKVFLERNKSAILVCNNQTAAKFTQYEDRIRIVDDGDSFTHGQWNFQFRKLRHGFFKGVHNLGVIISVGTFSFAHCGDAVEFINFPGQQVDVFAVPICGGFAASSGKVFKVVSQMTDPKPIIVPMHWQWRNPKSFCKKLHQQVPDVKCIVPVNGALLDIRL